jgi:hypothetical protein
MGLSGSHVHSSTESGVRSGAFRVQIGWDNVLAREGVMVLLKVVGVGGGICGTEVRIPVDGEAVAASDFDEVGRAAVPYDQDKPDMIVDKGAMVGSRVALFKVD